MIHWKLCKKFKFDYTTLWYMHKPESVVGNETLKVQWDIQLQTDHLISVSRPDLVIVNKKRDAEEQWTLLSR